MNKTQEMKSNSTERLKVELDKDSERYGGLNVVENKTETGKRILHEAARKRGRQRKRDISI